MGKLKSDRNREIVKLYLQGKGVSEIAQIYDFCYMTIRHILMRAGCTFSKKHPHWNSRCNQNRDLLLTMDAEGASLEEMARAVGSCGLSVKKFLRRNGVVRNFPRTLPGKRNPKWRGGRVVKNDGYVFVYSPDHPYRNRNKYVREHRLVMEKMLGRYLDPSEVVHHRDGNRQNNSPENLQLFSENKEHLSLELSGMKRIYNADGSYRMSESPALISVRERAGSQKGSKHDGRL